MVKIMFLIVFIIISCALNAKTIYFYGTSCKECGENVVKIYKEFCGLSKIISGGFNSACFLEYDRYKGQWILIARDPKDSFSGETQVCEIVCY